MFRYKQLKDLTYRLDKAIKDGLDRDYCTYREELRYIALDLISTSLDSDICRKLANFALHPLDLDFRQLFGDLGE